MLDNVWRSASRRTVPTALPLRFHQRARPLTTFFTPKCACRDCESAVSPVAYLADLLDYSTRDYESTRVVAKRRSRWSF